MYLAQEYTFSHHHGNEAEQYGMSYLGHILSLRLLLGPQPYLCENRLFCTIVYARRPDGVKFSDRNCFFHQF
tara:strand:+ start:1277 stop:1492 length:216 start_codon:yes stop_codon:yes gene_type:complete